MRIIGGKYKSRVLAEFPGTDVRPTGDRVKESLFNILSLKIGGARVLDLFCGSGALGLECLSRGAKEALEKNMKALGVVKGAEGKVYTLDFSVCLDGLKGGFDLIFLDPPYRFEYGVPALEKIARRGLLNENGIAVYERDKPFEERIDGLEKYDERRYGRTYLTFFRKI